jgi:hypothetical protein
MRHPNLVALTLLLALSVARADEPSDEALQFARRLTTAGAATFDTKDAKAMAAYYTDAAQLYIVSTDKD